MTTTTNRSNRRSGPPARRRPAPMAPVRSYAPMKQTFEVRPQAVVRAERAAQIIRALPAVIAVVGIVLAVISSVVIGAVLVVVGVVVFVSNIAIGSSRRLAALIGGRSVNVESDGRLINVVEGLCVANGLRKPELRIVDDVAPNAIVLGRSSETAVLVCTSGLLAELDRLELEGVIAHCLAHIKLGDLVHARTATTALGVFVAIFSSGGRVIARFAGLRNGPYADLAAVAMTRYPPGLIAALEKLAVVPTTRPSRLSTITARLTAAMWLVPLKEATPTHPIPGVLGVDLRIAALREL